MFLFFWEFSYFYKYFQSTFLWNQNKPKQTICIPEGRLNVFTALGHMLMASAQRWVDNQCCRCVLPCPDYETPIIPQLAATALILPSDTLGTVSRPKWIGSTRSVCVYIKTLYIHTHSECCRFTSAARRYPVVWYVGICDGKCLILLTCFVYMAIYDLEIQLFRSFSML